MRREMRRDWQAIVVYYGADGRKRVWFKLEVRRPVQHFKYTSVFGRTCRFREVMN